MSGPIERNKREKIGVFDSGVGGVTVLSVLRARFPRFDFVYFGDTANVPYGSKSPAQIQSLSSSAAERMRSHGLDALVVACNTASCWALPEFAREMGEVPVYGMVEFGVEAVREELKRIQDRQEENLPIPVVIFGTQATVKSGVYSRAFQSSVPGTEAPSLSLEERACPLLVPLIEEGWIEHPVLDAVLDEYVASSRTRAQGVALLACTHYPWIRAHFEKLLPGWTVIDSAQSLVRRFEGRFERGFEGDAEGVTVVEESTDRGGIEWFFSDPTAVPAFLADVAEKMSGGQVELRSF